MVSLYNLFKITVFSTPKKDAVLTHKWETDCVFWLMLYAGLDVGSVNFGLRLQDLQIKGKPKRKEHLHKFCLCGILSRHAYFVLADRINKSSHTCVHTHTNGFWFILMNSVGSKTSVNNL